MLSFKIIFAIAAVLAIVSVLGFGFGQKQEPQGQTPAVPEGHKVLVLAGGCFWCLDSIYRELKGVTHVESGYAGGQHAGVTYEEVSGGATGHAEVVRVTYDPKEVSGEDLLRIFFTFHDPTTLNRQGPDTGTQYRSAIFYVSDEEKALAEKVKAEIARAKIWKNPIVTSIEPLKNYTRAEEYHQDYFRKFENASAVEKMSMNAGYCRAIIQPKVIKFRQKYASKLKKAG